jgi:hypothetical protein
VFAAPAVAGPHALTFPARSTAWNCTTYVPLLENLTELPDMVDPKAPPLVE